jgi:hypothetical protein
MTAFRLQPIQQAEKCFWRDFFQSRYAIDDSTAILGEIFLPQICVVQSKTENYFSQSQFQKKS